MNYCNVRKNIVENKRKYTKGIDIHLYCWDMIPKALETRAQTDTHTHTMTTEARKWREIILKRNIKDSCTKMKQS